MTSSKLGIDNQTGETVYLHKASRRQGTYFIAATGVGKSTSLRYLIEQDIKQGIGVCVLDPHGDLINDVIGSLHRREDRDRVLLLDAQDKYRKFGINLYQCDDPTDDELVTNTYDRVEHIFKLVWGEDIAHMPLVMQGIQNSAYTFIDSSPAYNCTMLEIPMLFREMTPRAHMVGHLRDDNIQSWWKYYNDSPQATKDELARMVVNKVEGFTTNRLLRPIIGQSRSTIDFRQVIDSVDGKIVLIKMFGNNEKLTQLIGSLVIAQLLGAALSREDKARDERRQFHIYADEFELYATEDFTRLLKECRKYGMGVTLAHQSREDISNRNKAASLQVANIIVGRVIPDDAKDIAGMFDTTPPPAETRPEYVKTPTHKPVDFIVSGKSHPNEAVNTMLGKWKGFVERANEPIRDLRVRIGTLRGRQAAYDFVSNESIIRDTQLHLQLINDVLYQAMLEKNPRQVVPVALMFWMAKTFGLPFFDYKRYSEMNDLLLFKATHEYLNVHELADFYPLRDYFSFLIETIAWGEERKPTDEDIKWYILLWIVDDDHLTETLAVYEQRVREILYRDLRVLLPSLLNEINIQIYDGWNYFYWKEESERWHRLDGGEPPDRPSLWRFVGQEGGEPDYTLVRKFNLQLLLPFLPTFQSSFQWQKLDYKAEPRIRDEHELEQMGITKTMLENMTEKERDKVIYDYEHMNEDYRWALVPGQEEQILALIEPYIQAEIDRIIAEQKPSFETLVRQLREVMQALATQPIEDISGVVEEKPGTQRTYQDMQNEIASKLVKQPVGVAWCRVQNATGELEEHVIQLAQSTTPLENKSEVERWIEEIKERMLAHGYLRAITEVEKEISERHALLRFPPQPPEPPLLPDKPDEPPSSPRRKKIA